MSENEFEEAARQYASGDLSRRRFISRLVAGGISMTAAMAFANSVSSPTAFAADGSAKVYGKPPKG